jgi:hypothetical protein
MTSHGWRKTMDIDTAVAEYTRKSSTELADIVVKSYELSTAIAEAHPEMAQDAGFEWFDTSWATRYWRKVASEVSGLKAPDKVQSWAVNATISGVGTAIIAHYALPAVAVSAAVALAIILVRAAKASGPPAAV